MSEVAVAVYRKSQGDEDDVSLQLQRERVHDLASDHADEVEEVDLGVHTGFSIHMRPDSEERFDTNDKVLTLLEDLRSGEFDYLAAWDDTRLARDQFYWELMRAAIIGECELIFVDEPPKDSLTLRVQRAVESDVKRREIQKSKVAMEERQEQGHDQGRPPYGLCYDDASERWVPDREAEDGEKSDFQQALDVIKHRQKSVSWRNIADRTGVHKDTARSIWDRRERYFQEAEMS